MTTAEKLAKIKTTSELLQAHADLRSVASLEALGARVATGAQTNRISLFGVTATCTWSSTSGLVAAWMNAAARKIERMEA